ncbi:hypothetical protein RYX36_026584, partial [Vicia faba]
MVSQADDVAGIISSKAGLQYVGPDLDAMKAVADAHSKRSLKLFITALRYFKAQLEEDPIFHRHLSSLYDTLLEQNLCRLIEPFSRVEIAHIAEALFEVLDEIHQKSVVLSSHLFVSSIGFAEVAESLPVKIYTKSHKHQEEPVQCYICLVEYEDRDIMQVLPCHHEFHTTCID